MSPFAIRSSATRISAVASSGSSCAARSASVPARSRSNCDCAANDPARFAAGDFSSAASALFASSWASALLSSVSWTTEASASAIGLLGWRWRTPSISGTADETCPTDSSCAALVNSAPSLPIPFSRSASAPPSTGG